MFDNIKKGMSCKTFNRDVYVAIDCNKWISTKTGDLKNTNEIKYLGRSVVLDGKLIAKRKNQKQEWHACNKYI